MTTDSAKASASGVILLTLATGQFLMTLDSSVMNVSISQVAEDLGTTVTGIQTAITLYTLVMATLMITGGKIGSLIGRKRAFAIGCVIYGFGTLITAFAPNLAILILGWSVLEGIGAALIMPAIVGLVASNFPPQARPRAYGLIASAGAIAVAAGPLIGGFVTTYWTWRYVFAGEAVLVVGILFMIRRMADAPAEAKFKMDYVGIVLSALGLGLAVFGVLKSGEWGWVQPKPEGPDWLGISPTFWLIVVGLVLVRLFFAWELRMLERGKEPLVRPEMLRNAQLAGGLTMFFFQFMIQAGLFFIVPLFLSVALGLTAPRHRGTAPAAVGNAAPGRGGDPEVLPPCLAPECRAPRAGGAPGGDPLVDRRVGGRGRARDHPGPDAARRARCRCTRVPVGGGDRFRRLR